MTPNAEKSSKFAAIPSPDDTPKFYYDSKHYPQQSLSHRYTRWPFLLTASILIAIISGLIGGFVGKAIEDNRHNGQSHNDQSSNGTLPTPSACPTLAPLDNTRNITSQNSTSELSIPQTGCPDVSGRTFQSNFSKVSYRIYCNVDWPQNDIVGVFAETMSDCIEACETVNSNGLTDGNNNAFECKASVFSPQWINRTRAMEDVQHPSNCYLKHSVTDYPKNSRETDGIDIVGLCLEGKCPGQSG